MCSVWIERQRGRGREGETERDSEREGDTGKREGERQSSLESLKHLGLNNKTASFCTLLSSFPKEEGWRAVEAGWL